MIFQDQLGRTIELSIPARRIISLVPSQTELLYDLGLEEEVIGITKFCVKPAHWHGSKARVGGTKSVNLSAVRALEPDLILANKEENDRLQIEELATDYPVWISDVVTLEHALDMIRSVAELTGADIKGDGLVQTIDSGFRDLEPPGTRSAVYMVWNDPPLCAGSGTFIEALMSKAGFNNIISLARYPNYEDEPLSINPDLVLLPSEPFPFSKKHIPEFQERFPNSQVILVDGEMFSWYGSRLKHFPAYVRELRSQL